ncbi:MULTISPECIES: glutamyl-tRNA reductase [Arthrobacter]|uniref:Glutamyl-tRNA reductase n=1 Tax=Arthrobacter sunyaminii TaxID=2816859 RepID=A0A975S5E9_9MICC|nr:MULTISPECIES: glutamyl-tRNA reductase [Arthrobacter]MBO0897869.1 glutamyl-tRNA reductase [Arthrobacter sunyaminii]MBO0908999.1 glutamyl-tRNA reductase [Arthrobacter sunyaminii]QWQ35504.1 glutamyl-tRNA reductase [Arthrobacter sunyaminii]
MVLLSLIATHSDVDLETVARLSAGASQVSSSLLETGSAVTGSVVLATCNRFEVYCEAKSEADIEAARSAVVAEISRHSGLSKDLVSRSLDTNTGESVAKHLFAVGAGLDSAVVGEREIAGQVRRALIEAQEKGTASGGLTRLFQTASRTAKDVGALTALGKRGLSIVSVALELATDLSMDTDWSAKDVVVFGTGAYAGATMALLKERGCTRISVYSSSGRAESFTASRGGTPLTRESLPDALAAADVVIGCSGSESQVSAGDIRRVRKSSNKPLIIIDLALTHDFDPDVREVDGVELITLESVRLAAPAEQVESLKQASSIVADAAKAFSELQLSRQMDSAIVALRRHTLNVLDSELEKVRAQHGCTGAAEEVEFAMRRMVKQLLHVPTVRARELAASGQQDDYIKGLEALFGITLDQPVERRRPSAPHGPAHHGSTEADNSEDGADTAASA